MKQYWCHAGEGPRRSTKQGRSRWAGQLGVEPPTGSSLMQKATLREVEGALRSVRSTRSFCEIDGQGDHADDIKEYKKEASKKDAAGQLAHETLPTRNII